MRRTDSSTVSVEMPDGTSSVFELVAASNRAKPTVEAATAALSAFARFEDVLACFGDEPAADAGSDAPAELLEKLAQRNAAKKEKDWATADRLRDEVAAAGWKIVDTPQGARLEKV